MAKSWKDIFKTDEDLKKAVRGATGQKEPKKRPKKDETEMQRRLRLANEAKRNGLKNIREYGN